jgi:hypothetical protein
MAILTYFVVLPFSAQATASLSQINPSKFPMRIGRDVKRSGWPGRKVVP